MRIYKQSISSIYGIKNRPVWISNTYASYFFEKKNYLRNFYFFKKVIHKKLNTKIKYIILNLIIFYKIHFLNNLKKNIKRIKILFNRIKLYEIKKKNFDFIDELKAESYKFKIIEKYEEFQKYNNFFI